ncbi:MAG: response regulator transcription factor [Candidatus Melainabacteria bacterium]|nr:response regulator transcription factor [Candidatus Melainabacteria bacterium]
MTAHILVVEDDEKIAEVLQDCLTEANYEVEVVHSAEAGSAMLSINSYNLLILDWQLPKASGLDLCTEARAKGINTPVLFLTGMDSVGNKMAGLDSGADDYLTKPFAIPEVLARVRALLRRPQTLQYKPLTVRNLELDQRNKSVRLKDEAVKLHPQEFTVLELLMSNPGRVFSAEELLSRAWPTDSDATNEAVRTVILRIRKVVDIDSDNPLITTIKGFGYKLEL